MKDSSRQRWQILMPLFAAGFFAIETLNDYRDTGEVEVHYIIAIVLFLVCFALFSYFSRARK